MGFQKAYKQGSKDGNKVKGHPYFFLSSVFGCLFARHFKLSLSSHVMMTKNGFASSFLLHMYMHLTIILYSSDLRSVVIYLTQNFILLKN